MDIEEVIKWLKIMKANLNSFPEVSSGKKIEALAEAIRLLINEQSENSTGSIIKNDLGVEKVEVRKPCINYEDGCEEWAGCPCVNFKARK